MKRPSRSVRPIDVGTPAPSFFLKTPYGIEVSLTARLLEGAVVVEFVRGGWDPDSRQRLRTLAAEREAFRELGASILVVARERPGTMATYLEEKPTPLTVLVDPDGTVTRAYGVLQRFSLPVWNVARPSSFVVDRCGFVRYAYVARLRIHSAPVEEILTALRELA